MSLHQELPTALGQVVPSKAVLTIESPVLKHIISCPHITTSLCDQHSDACTQILISSCLCMTHLVSDQCMMCTLVCILLTDANSCYCICAMICAHILVLLLQSRLFVEGGVNKIRLTGGEPTLRRDIVDLTGQLNALPGLQAIGITTNGIALKRKLPDLQAQGTVPSSWHTVLASDMPCSKGQSTPLLANLQQNMLQLGLQVNMQSTHKPYAHHKSTLHSAAKPGAHDGLVDAVMHAPGLQGQ